MERMRKFLRFFKGGVFFLFIYSSLLFKEVSVKTLKARMLLESDTQGGDAISLYLNLSYSIEIY
jgi:hypothetical protein